MSIERWHLYTKAIPPVASADPLYFYNVVIPIRDLPGRYEMRALEMYPPNSDKSFKARDGNGSYFMTDFVETATWNSQNQPQPIWPPLTYPYDQVFRFDLYQAVTEGPTTLWPVMHGVHILDGDGEVVYPEHFRETPYTHQIEAVLATDDLVLLRDHNGQAFSNIPLPWQVLFGGDASIPVTPSPELVMPAGRGFTLEIISTPTGVRKIPVYLNFNCAFAVRQLLAVTKDDVGTIQFNFGGALLNAI